MKTGTIVLSVVSLVLSVVAIVISGTRTSLPGKGLSEYDFSTPQAAVKSQMQMEASGDVRASIELKVAEGMSEKDLKDKAVETLQFDRAIEHEGKAVVFYKFKKGGLDYYETMWLEKKPDGRFYPTYQPTYSWSENSGDKGRIYKAIKDWEAKNKE